MDQLQLRKLQLARVAGQQELPAHLRLLDHGDLNLPGVLLKDELVPQERRTSSKHHLVTRDLQLVDADSDVAEAPLVTQEVHLLQHGVPKCGEAELKDHLVLGHSEPQASKVHLRRRHANTVKVHGEFCIMINMLFFSFIWKLRADIG